MQANCIHTCCGNNIVTAPGLLPLLYWCFHVYRCVRQKLFNLSDIKAGDTSAGDAFPSWGGVDPRVATHHILLSTLRQ